MDGLEEVEAVGMEEALEQYMGLEMVVADMSIHLQLLLTIHKVVC